MQQWSAARSVLVVGWMLVAGACDETARDTACKSLHDSEREQVARMELHKELATFGAGDSSAAMSDGGHTVQPSDVAGIRVDELILSYRGPVESDLEMEAFEFEIARTPGFRWSILLYDTAISGFDSCPSKFGMRWAAQP